VNAWSLGAILRRDMGKMKAHNMLSFTDEPRTFLNKFFKCVPIILIFQFVVGVNWILFSQFSLIKYAEKALLFTGIAGFFVWFIGLNDVHHKHRWRFAIFLSINIFSVIEIYLIRKLPTTFWYFGLFIQYVYLSYSIRDQLKSERVQVVLAKYIDTKIIDELLMSKKSLFPGGQKEILTILFADLRGFTSFAESQTPEVVAYVLNRFFENSISIIQANGGTVDNLIGDCIMAFFGNPISQTDHADRAVKAALNIQRAVLLEKTNLRDMEVGVGIDTGYVLVGNLGSIDRVNYTVIGDHVNTAARVASKAGPREILITENTKDKLKADFNFIEIKELALKGKINPVKVFKMLHHGK
jgi:adenylate cyclase